MVYLQIQYLRTAPHSSVICINEFWGSPNAYRELSELQKVFRKFARSSLFFKVRKSNVSISGFKTHWTPNIRHFWGYITTKLHFTVEVTYLLIFWTVLKLWIISDFEQIILKFSETNFQHDYQNFTICFFCVQRRMFLQ